MKTFMTYSNKTHSNKTQNLFGKPIAFLWTKHEMHSCMKLKIFVPKTRENLQRYPSGSILLTAKAYKKDKFHEETSKTSQTGDKHYAGREQIKIYLPRGTLRQHRIKAYNVKEYCRRRYFTLLLDTCASVNPLLVYVDDCCWNTRDYCCPS